MTLKDSVNLVGPKVEAQRTVSNALTRLRAVFAETPDFLTAREVEAAYRRLHPGGAVSVKRIDEGLRYLEEQREIILVVAGDAVPKWRRTARLVR